LNDEHGYNANAKQVKEKEIYNMYDPQSLYTLCKRGVFCFAQGLINRADRRSFVNVYNAIIIDQFFTHK